LDCTPFVKLLNQKKNLKYLQNSLPTPWIDYSSTESPLTESQLVYS
jgi:hypothetical protein